MMGRKGLQGKWFYNFSLEDRVPQDHFLRSVNKVVDFTFVRDLVRQTYSHTGAPSVDPVVVFKMALLGYLYGITSERRLADEIRLNLAYLWFLGYDLDEWTTAFSPRPGRAMVGRPIGSSPTRSSGSALNRAMWMATGCTSTPLW